MVLTLLHSILRRVDIFFADDYEEEDAAAQRPVQPAKAPPTQGQKPAASRDVFGGTASGSAAFSASTLAAHNGILTVADDLLKNDGTRFLEMMESITLKRLQKEREFAQRVIEDEDEDEEDDDEDDEDEGEQRDYALLCTIH